MTADIPSFFQETAPTVARLAVLNRKFGVTLDRLRGCTLQKVSASDEGYVILHVYRPGERSVVVFSIRAGHSGVILEDIKPVSQQSPNAFVQIARKYLLGRRIVNGYALMSPSGLVLEFSPPSSDHPERETLLEGPDCLVLDLDTRPVRVCLTKKWDTVPQRYGHVASHFSAGSDFFESFCEWSLQNTKTRRRATFEEPVVGYCILTYLLPPEAPRSDPTSLHRSMLAVAKKPSAETMKLEMALTYLPSHVRQAARTRLRFLIRRLNRQRGDLPPVGGIERQEKVAQGLRASIYLWPKEKFQWYVPPTVIAEYGLAPLYELDQGEKPGDIVNMAFRRLEKLSRRREELLKRIEKSENALAEFEKIVRAVALQVRETLASYSREEPASWKNSEKDVLSSRIRSPEVERLCHLLDVSWSEAVQRRRIVDVEAVRRLPYRSFRASTGEFIRVAKSARDGDLMLKLMPSNHVWIHVLIGEGSHVWLEKPKRRKPTDLAVREAAILAIHFSRLSKTLGGEVRVATRADVEKKKDLPPGKVLVRRCQTSIYRYAADELRRILHSGHPGEKDDADGS